MKTVSRDWLKERSGVQAADWCKHCLKHLITHVEDSCLFEPTLFEPLSDATLFDDPLVYDEIFGSPIFLESAFGGDVTGLVDQQQLHINQINWEPK
jgi:hypothetical protein